MKRFQVISGTDCQVTEEIRKLQNTVGVEDVDISNLHAYWNGALTIITVVVTYQYRD